MKIWKDRRSGFTLVELLVVIAIISIVAMATFSAVKGARRQANATKCQANMKNLHTAVVAYFADKQYYPPASSYEVYRKELSKNGKKEYWYERQGWVSWIPSAKDSSRRNGDRETPWQKNSGKSYASKFYYPENNIEDTKAMRDAIEEGAIYKYAGKNHETYMCPDNKLPNGQLKPLAYAMNCWFHCHYDRAWTLRSAGVMGNAEPSKIVLFVEIDDECAASGNADRSGQDGSQSVNVGTFQNDACWDWQSKITIGSGANKKEYSGTVETGRFTHRRGKKENFWYTHVVFLDGHVATIGKKDTDTWPSGASDVKDVFAKFGEGDF